MYIYIRNKHHIIQLFSFCLESKTADTGDGCYTYKDRYRYECSTLLLSVEYSVALFR